MATLTVGGPWAAAASRTTLCWWLERRAAGRAGGGGLRRLVCVYWSSVSPWMIGPLGPLLVRVFWSMSADLWVGPCLLAHFCHLIRVCWSVFVGPCLLIRVCWSASVGPYLLVRICLWLCGCCRRGVSLLPSVCWWWWGVDDCDPGVQRYHRWRPQTAVVTPSVCTCVRVCVRVCATVRVWPVCGDGAVLTASEQGIRRTPRPLTECCVGPGSGTVVVSVEGRPSVVLAT